MPQFMVDDDLAELVWSLAKPRPFENLSFSAALRRVLPGAGSKSEGDPMVLSSKAAFEGMSIHTPSGKKAVSPSAAAWAQQVHELKSRRNLTTWQAICEFLKIDTAGDSARRKLRNWVRANRPNWPEVPEISSNV
jgi:hypothetical protein